MGIAFAKVKYPYRSIDENHADFPILRRRIGRMLFSVPPKSANRFALSRAISASKPNLTSDVFSSTPVSFIAFFKSSESMLSVVLDICISMPILGI